MIHGISGCREKDEGGLHLNGLVYDFVIRYGRKEGELFYLPPDWSSRNRFFFFHNITIWITLPLLHPVYSYIPPFTSMHSLTVNKNQKDI